MSTAPPSLSPTPGFRGSPDLTRRAAAVALGAAILDLAILAALHALQPGVDPLTEPTSNYANGRAGIASQVGTFLAGVGALALGVAVLPLRSRVPSRGPLTVGLVLLTLFAVAKLVQAFFPIDAEDTVTAAGAVHNALGNVAFFVLPVAAVLVGGAISQLVRRRGPVLLGWLVVATTMLVLAAGGFGLFGLAQRIYLVTAALWVALSAVAVRSGTQSH